MQDTRLKARGKSTYEGGEEERVVESVARETEQLLSLTNEASISRKDTRSTSLAIDGGGVAETFPRVEVDLLVECSETGMRRDGLSLLVERGCSFDGSHEDSVALELGDV